MLQVVSISKSHQTKALFKNITFSLMPGQKLSLVGRNGCGKSSLMNLLAGREEPDDGQIQWARGTRVGYLDQHRKFHGSDVLQEVVDALPESYHGLSYKAEQILIGLGIAEGLWPLKPEELSGGYRLRLSLAVLLAQEPDMLLLDEPTNYLDLPSTLWLTRFLKAHSSAAVIISHDRSFLDSVCSFTAGIYAGKFFFVSGNTEEYFQHLMLMEHAQSSLKQKIDRHISKQRSFIERFGAKASKAKQAKSKEKQLAKLPVVEEWILAHDLEIDIKSMPRPLEKGIITQELRFSYDSTPLIGPVNLEWSGVDRLAFVGANGRGKSTFLKLLIGELTPTDGVITRPSGAQLGYFGQRSIELLDVELTPLEALVQQRHAQSRQDGKRVSEQECRKNLGTFGIDGTMQERKIGTLSGGERARVVLAQIASQPSHGLILDEPTHHLDIETVESMLQAIQSFEGCVILVTHSPSTLESFNPDQLLVFEKGEQIWYRGSYDMWIESELAKSGESFDGKTKAARSKGAVSNETQRELAKQITALERKMKEKDKLAEAAKAKIEKMGQELALAHEERNLNQAHFLIHELHKLEVERDAYLADWFELAQTLELKQNEL